MVCMYLMAVTLPHHLVVSFLWGIGLCSACLSSFVGKRGNYMDTLKLLDSCALMFLTEKALSEVAVT